MHSTILQHLGLPNGLKALCRTFSQQYQITVDLEAEPVENLGDDISLCLYRVTQEALNNAVTHGHAKKITVSLARDAGFLCLRIKDAGIGFEPAVRPEGLGLGEHAGTITHGGRQARRKIFTQPGHGSRSSRGLFPAEFVKLCAVMRCLLQLLADVAPQ